MDGPWLARRVRHPVARVLASAMAFVGLLLCVLGFRLFVLEPFRIPAASMVPTLQVGDHVAVVKYAYGLRIPLLGTYLVRWDEPHRGDVVVFAYPRDPAVSYVKRVVGVPGDRVAVRNGSVVLDGIVLDRADGDDARTWADDGCTQRTAASFVEVIDGVPRRMFRNHGLGGPLSDMAEITVPNDHVFVMGDNRDNSEDSRRWGFVSMDAIYGRAWRIWLSLDPCSGGVRKERFMLGAEGGEG
jgi:signal peptidase I